jgi:nucleotide-binding universal stress UspA family protein
MDCLVYVDGSHRGEWVLSLAAQLPRAYAPRMVLLATAEDEALAPGLLARARARLAVTGAALEEKASPGPAERAILEESKAHSYDLIIVPPAGRNALTRMLKGSRVATVVRSVRASVLVARRPPARLSRILAAVSGGAASEAVVASALRLESALGARATFLHVASEIALPFERPAGSAEEAVAKKGVAPGTDPAEDARRLLQARGRALVEREGLVVDEVIAEVEQGAHDLLVVGAPPLRDRSWGREDTTERLLLACPTSILVVRAPDPS